MFAKKYQIFVSSTFLDLKNERQAVSRAILNLGHIPAGMELFPASDTDQLSFIKKVIDDCDYYVLIIGGKYGSVSEEGLSYTEMEYRYAIEKKKPVLAFIHYDTKELKAKDVDIDEVKLEKLAAFQAHVKTGRLIESWTSIDSLESKTLLALTNAFNEQPQTGWRRDTGDVTAEIQQRLDKLRERYDFMRERYDRENKRATEFERKLNEYNVLEDAEIEIRYTLDDDSTGTISLGAEEIIREFAFTLIDGLSLEEIEHGLVQHIFHKHSKAILTVSDLSIKNVALFFEVFEICHPMEDEILSLMEDKKWLLKAAFKPLKKVIKEYNDDVIPF